MSSWVYSLSAPPQLLPRAHEQVEVKILVNNKPTRVEATLCRNTSNPSFFSKDASYKNSWHMFNLFHFYRTVRETWQHILRKEKWAHYFHTDSVYYQLPLRQFSPRSAIRLELLSPKPRQNLSSIIKRYVCVDVVDRFERNIGQSKRSADSQACAAIWWSQLGKEALWERQGLRSWWGTVPWRLLGIKI